MSSVFVGDVSSVFVGDVLSVVIGDVSSVLPGDVFFVVVGDVSSALVGDGDSGAINNPGKTCDGEGDGAAVRSGTVLGGMVSTVKDLAANIVNIKVVITPSVMRRHFNLRCRFIDDFVFSSITRVPLLQLSLPGFTLIKGIPSTRQNASNASS